MSERHVTPTGDLIAHEDSEDCACGPDAERIVCGDGSTAGYVYIHHSLDGRERDK